MYPQYFVFHKPYYLANESAFDCFQLFTDNRIDRRHLIENVVVYTFVSISYRTNLIARNALYKVVVVTQTDLLLPSQCNTFAYTSTRKPRNKNNTQDYYHEVVESIDILRRPTSSLSPVLQYKSIYIYIYIENGNGNGHMDISYTSAPDFDKCSSSDAFR